VWGWTPKLPNKREKRNASDNGFDPRRQDLDEDRQDSFDNQSSGVGDFRACASRWGDQWCGSLACQWSSG